MDKKTKSNKKLSTFGIGTWGLGGYAERDPENKDDEQIESLVYMLAKGINFADLCPWYSEWKAVELFKQTLDQSGVIRDDIFLVASIYPHRNETLADANEELDKLLEIMETDYMDSIQYTLSGMVKWGLEESLENLKNLLTEDKVKNISITNANTKYLKIMKETFKNKFFSHEVQFNFEIRENFDEGNMPFASENGITNVVYQALRRNKTKERNWELLEKLTSKYGKTQNQIILSWMASLDYKPLIKSVNKKHIDENLEALSLHLEQEDIDKLNKFRPPGWKSPEIDWDKSGKGISVSQISNIFDEQYDNK